MTNTNPPEPTTAPNDYKILYITDTHLSVIKSKNKLDSYKETHYILDQLIDIISSQQINMAILGGDLFDRGSDLEDTWHMNQVEQRLERIHQLLQGNLFMVMGNHEYTYSKNNPTFRYLDILDESVKQLYVKRECLQPTRKLIKVVSNIRFSNFDIQFKHFSPDKSLYKIPENNTYTIGLYHDDLITTQSQSELYHHQQGKGISAANTDVFANVDLALLAHIHKPLQPTTLNNPRQTKIIVPGAVKSNNAGEQHEITNLPVLTIPNYLPTATETNPTPPVNLSYIPFKLLKYQDSYDLQAVQAARERRQLSKDTKSGMLLTQKGQDLEDMLTQIKNPNIVRYIREAIHPLQTDSAQQLTEIITS